MKQALKSAMRAGVALALITPGVAHADVIIGPRVAYYFDNSNLRTSSIPAGQQDQGGVIDQQALELAEERFPGDVEFNSQQDGIGLLADQIAVPMVGAMVNFGDDRDRFTISGLYGEGSGSLSQTQAISRSLSIGESFAVDFGRAVVDADYDYRRVDLEATWQRRTSENFAFLLGVRYERLSREGPGVGTIGLTSNVDNLLFERLAESFGMDLDQPFQDQVPIPFNFVDTAQQETFSARGGVTAFVPINENATAFFNGMVHASHQPSFNVETVTTPLVGDPFVSIDQNASEFSLGPDFAVGAQFILSDSLALDIRYRANLFFPLSGDQSFSDSRVNHGVNLGLSLRL